MTTPGKLFGIGAVVQIIIVGLMIWAVVAGVSYVQKHGLKTIATEVWEGTEADSTNNK
jgi:hypothetical protein